MSAILWAATLGLTGGTSLGSLLAYGVGKRHGRDEAAGEREHFAGIRALRDVPEIPIGAEPAPVWSRDRSGLASPAAATAARTSGNAAPPLEVETPPPAGALAGPPSWLLRLGGAMVATLLADPVGAAREVTRSVCAYDGRHHDTLGTVAQRRHSRAAEQRSVHAAWTMSTDQWPKVDDEELARFMTPRVGQISRPPTRS